MYAGGHTPSRAGRRTANRAADSRSAGPPRVGPICVSVNTGETDAKVSSRMDADPERNESALRLASSASFQNALAAGGLIVLLAWPIAWIVGVARRAIARHR